MSPVSFHQFHFEEPKPKGSPYKYEGTDAKFNVSIQPDWLRSSQPVIGRELVT